MNADTGQIAAAVLTTSNVDDAPQFGAFLNQKGGPVALFTPMVLTIRTTSTGATAKAGLLAWLKSLQASATFFTAEAYHNKGPDEVQRLVANMVDGRGEKTGFLPRANHGFDPETEKQAYAMKQMDAIFPVESGYSRAPFELG